MITSFRIFRHVLCCSILTLLLLETYGQNEYCGTKSTDRYLSVLRSQRHQIAKHRSPQTRSITQFPIAIYVIHQSDGTGGLSTPQVDSLIAGVNQKFAPAGIGLSRCDTVHFINDDTFFEFRTPDENDLTNQYNTPNTINLYLPNTITTGGGNSLCGYTYFPGWQEDLIVLTSSCALDGSSLHHEIGHYFGLLHTHGLSNIGLTDELVDWSNCFTAGDDVCDTPADPNLLDASNSDCEYTGDETDQNGMPFEPNVVNIMSYAPKHCKTEFTNGQYTRMNFVATYLRDYLGCQLLSANFEVSPRIGWCTDAQEVNLLYTGNGGTNIAWDLNGDGFSEFDGNELTHLFEAGSYEICATASTQNNAVTRCMPFAVQVSDVISGWIDEPFDRGRTKGIFINPDHHYGWTIGQLGLADDYCLVIDNYHYNAVGQEDHFAIGPVDLHTLNAPILSFRYAYALPAEGQFDALRIEISTDCGESYSEIGYMAGSELATINGNVDWQWMPSSSSDWEIGGISLIDYQYDTAIIRFTNITGFGNNLYLDDVVLQEDPLLAVDFLTFRVKADAHSQNHLHWQVANEEQIAAFSIEHSVDGTRFETLADVAVSAGGATRYEFVHRTPAVSEQYRIAAQLIDGSTIFSPIVTVEKSDSGRPHLYPNPSSQKILVENLVSEIDRIMVLNIQGQSVTSQCVFRRLNNVLEIDISNLRPGLFAVTSGVWTGRFVKE